MDENSQPSENRRTPGVSATPLSFRKQFMLKSSTPLRKALQTLPSNSNQINKLNHLLTESSKTPSKFMNSNVCHFCESNFSTFLRRHHCRQCGRSVCAKDSRQFVAERREHLSWTRSQR
jgi:hypothetical protein